MNEKFMYLFSSLHYVTIYAEIWDTAIWKMALLHVVLLHGDIFHLAPTHNEQFNSKLEVTYY